MIEKLFRGRIKKTKKWVYGYYCKSPITDGNSGLPPSAGWYFLSGEERHLIIQDSVAYTVDPETVGQYTGLDDKNGVKIFEGDILYHPIQGKRKVYYPFSEKVSSYGLRMIEGKVRMASTLSDGFLYEVIGNIHDNVEQMEG